MQATDDLYAQLTKLDDLRKKGILTDERISGGEKENLEPFQLGLAQLAFELGPSWLSSSWSRCKIQGARRTSSSVLLVKWLAPFGRTCALQCVRHDADASRAKSEEEDERAAVVRRPGFSTGGEVGPQVYAAAARFLRVKSRFRL